MLALGGAPPRRDGAWFALAVLLSLAGLAGSCKSKGPRVLSLTIAGNQQISTAALKAVMTTRTSGPWPWSAAVLFDQQAFAADLERLRVYYRDHGYPSARIADVAVTTNETRDGVRIRLTIDEGSPTIVTGVQAAGTTDLDPEIVRQIDLALPQPGHPRDQDRIVQSEQHILDVLLDRGYAYAAIHESEIAAPPGGTALTFTITPGPGVVFGPMTFVGLVRLTEPMARREISFKTGERYDRDLVIRSEHRLTSLELLRFANIDARPPAGPQLSAIPVTITVSENRPRRLEAGIGYGSEERVRGSLTWTHLDFLGGAREAAISSKWSSIDRGVRASLSQPWVFVRGLSLDASATEWWTSQLTYTSHTTGGRIGLSYRVNSAARGSSASAGPAGDLIRLTYIHEYLAYQVAANALQNPNGFAELVTLGLDPVTGRGVGTKASVAFDVEHNAVDNELDPHHGYGASVHVEDANPALGGTFRFTEYLVEGRGYIPLGHATFAVRSRYGVLNAGDDAEVPFSARYFLGGSTSLRGWGRYEVAPLLDGLPIGGRATVDGTVELRVPVRGALGAVGFMDVGNVFATRADLSLGDLQRDAGFGIRYRTPFGLLRVDMGFQLNPIAGLIVNAMPETRHWRVHFSIGQSF